MWFQIFDLIFFIGFVWPFPVMYNNAPLLISVSIIFPWSEVSSAVFQKWGLSCVGTLYVFWHLSSDDRSGDKLEDGRREGRALNQGEEGR